MGTPNDPWGRVDTDGTVYVRTAEGERVVGSWQAGEPEEALAFFQRKYEALVTEIDLLEQRIKTTDLPPSQAQAGIERLREAVADAHAVGDLGALTTRIDDLTGLLDHRREEVRAAREKSRDEARHIKERIVGEAERIAAEATHWKISGERMRQLLDEWKAAPRVDRATESTLWKRLSAARNAFTKRRKAYFSNLEEERETARIRKEKLVAEAESLATSTDWGPTAASFRDLMRSWKSAGRAARGTEDDLWNRFKAAQDNFFHARSDVFTERDSELRNNATAKEELLAEAQRLVPVKDARACRGTLRAIHERWEAIGLVPRELRDQLEGGLRRVEEAVRKAEESEWQRTNPEALARAEATVNQLRAAIGQLEKQLTTARDTGNTRAVQQAEEALTARRAWLEEAERTLTELSS